MEENPYSASDGTGQNILPFRKIGFTPISYMQRSYRMIRERYFLFFGIVLCALLLGALAPLGILLGPMLTGAYMCFLQHESGNELKFETLFQGFDRFVASLLVTLAALFCNILISLTFTAVCVAGVLIFLNYTDPQSVNAIPASVAATVFAVGYIALLLCSFLAYVPFAFCFQLIAEHNVSAGTAIATSTRAAFHNLVPLSITYVFLSFIGFAAALLCYLPLFFVMPIQLGATFLIYRDIFPRTAVEETDSSFMTSHPG